MATQKNKLLGFSMVEMLVVIGIFVVLASFAYPLYSSWQLKTGLESSRSEVIEALRIARYRSQSGLNDSTHGVYFSLGGNDSYIIYQGESHGERNDLYDLEYFFDSNINISTQIVDINFIKSSGYSQATSTIYISDENDSTQVNINRLGIISY